MRALEFDYADDTAADDIPSGTTYTTADWCYNVRAAALWRARARRGARRRRRASAPRRPLAPPTAA